MAGLATGTVCPQTGKVLSHPWAMTWWSLQAPSHTNPYRTQDRAIVKCFPVRRPATAASDQLVHPKRFGWANVAYAARSETCTKVHGFP